MVGDRWLFVLVSILVAGWAHESKAAKSEDLIELAERRVGEPGDVLVGIEDCRMLVVHPSSDRWFGMSAVVYVNYLNLSDVDSSKTNLDIRSGAISVTMKRGKEIHSRTLEPMDNTRDGRLDWGAINLPDVPVAVDDFNSDGFASSVIDVPMSSEQPDQYKFASDRTGVLYLNVGHKADTTEIIQSFNAVVDACQ